MPAHSKYDPSRLEDVRRLCELFGATNFEIAQFLGVGERTVYTWQTQYPEFKEACKLGKEVSDQRVVRRLYERSVGYSYESEKIFMTKDGAIVRAETVVHVPPDVKASELWLTNRMPEDWRVRREFTGADGKPLVPYDGNELARRIAYALDPRVMAAAKPH